MTLQRPDDASILESTSSGHVATFHLSDGSRLVVAVAGAIGFSCGGDRGRTRLELLGADGQVRARANLAGLLLGAGRS